MNQAMILRTAGHQAENFGIFTGKQEKFVH